MYRWIQVTAEESEELQNKGLVTINSGYKYKSRDGVDMVEYHVDSCSTFEETLNGTTRFGGHLSVRREPGNDRPLLIFGHDECIFKQYHMTKSAWVAPDGQRVLVPKDDGQGLMISAFQSREFGFGLEISEEDLKKVNEARVGQKYLDEAAANAKRGTVEKKELKNSPFIIEFEYGANNEGYWSYDHMVLQLEDCVDCLNVLAPDFDILFLFDHSCGHDRQREDGLNVENMSKSFGGKQAYLRNSLIKEVDGYLGPYPRILNPGDVQSMVFTTTDSGPFWLSAKEKEDQKHDQVIQGKTVKRRLKKEELVRKLAEVGVTATGNYTAIQKLAVEKNIPLVEENLPKIKLGWMGKQKGILQVLWERGFIDEANINQYTMDGRKDAFGVHQPQTSLKHLLSSCTDFEEEESLLQSMGRRMGVLVDRTPKCHCELAGEGIEYSWGCSKNYYRSLPLKEKKTKELFKTSVRKCLSREILTTNRVRSFSRRARQYILAYHALNLQQLQQVSGKDDNIISMLQNEAQITPAKIEHMVKEFKTHRCAMDFDGAFIKSVMVKKEDQ
jgi:hypothetical protein